MKISSCSRDAERAMLNAMPDDRRRGAVRNQCSLWGARDVRGAA
jgi:hypothetical protein